MRYRDLKFAVQLELLYWTLVPFAGIEQTSREVDDGVRNFYYLRLRWLCFDVTIGPALWLTWTGEELKKKQAISARQKQPRGGKQ